MPISLRERVCRAAQAPRSDTILMGRAELLAVEDRDLIEAVLIRGQTASSVARLMGWTPKRVRGRVKRLLRRMNSRAFLDAARALPYLAPADAALARLHFCQGLAHRKLCVRLGLTVHAMRRRLDRVSAQIETIARLAAASGAGAAQPTWTQRRTPWTPRPPRG